MDNFGGRAANMLRESSSAVMGALPRRHKPDHVIIVLIGLLMLLGLVIMYAIGPQRANVLNALHNTDYYTSTYFVVKQTISLVIALGAFVAMTLLPFRFVQRSAKSVLLAGFAACVLLFIFGNILHIESIAQCSLGACRWFELGPLGGFQPAELLKFGMLLTIAGFLSVRIRQGKLNDWQETIMPIAVLTAIAMLFVIVIQKDMGTGISMTAILVAMGMISGIDKKIGLILLGVILAAGVMMIVLAPHRMQRLGTFFQGDNVVAEDGSDYHIKHAKIAIGTGGLFGVGIGNSVQATGYLPEAINDSVFAIMAETFGFVGVTLILGLFAALILRVLRVSDRLDDAWMKLVVAGVFGWLASHVLLNVGSMIGLFPLTGITLPLLSFGGTSMIFIAAALGIVFQLSGYTRHTNTPQEVGYADSRSRRGFGGSRDTRRRRYSGN